MQASEPPPIALRYIVLRGQDEGRVGLVVDILEMEEVIGGWWEVLCAVCRCRPPASMVNGVA